MGRPEIFVNSRHDVPSETPPAPIFGGFRLRSHILLIGGFFLGAGAGTFAKLSAPDNAMIPLIMAWFVRPVEQVFLGVLFLLIIPFLFSAIISGVSRMRSSEGVQGLLTTTIVYMLAVSVAGALIGLAMANLFRPGDGVPADVGHQLLAMRFPHFSPLLDGSLPRLLMGNNLIMAMIVVSFLIAVITPSLRRRSGHWLLSGCEKLFSLSMKILSLVMRFAPLAVGCFMFDLTVVFGWHMLLNLSAYVIVVIAALALQIVLTFFVVVWMRGDYAPTLFLRNVQEAALVAFSTSSSNATLPSALKVAEVDLRLPGRIARPVLGIGTIANQSGTAIYTAVTVLFIGQFFGMDLMLDRQAIVFGIAVLAGMGTVGVPAGALPIVATTLAVVGLPPEGIGLVIGVDRLLDMFRTLVNVVGDLAISVAITREPLTMRGEGAAVVTGYETN